MRTHRCGELRAEHAGTEVTLCGWVGRQRDHGGVLFVDLRDREGYVQVVFHPEENPSAHGVAEGLKGESVVRVVGEVRPRPEGTVNPGLPTGEVEVAAKELEVLSAADTPPFPIEDRISADEKLRLRYRYLDIRRPELTGRLQTRHHALRTIRRFFDQRDFVEVETPMLTRSTPEGARDFLVPSRLQPGEFYALPQSPQLFKQILMVAGLDRYYQIVRCFRDEDLRADRQPDFTQLDLEMSFVEMDEVLDVTERLFRSVWREVLGVELADFPRLSFQDSMERFGTDKPDLRFGMELVDLGEVFASTEVRVFRSVLDQGGAVKAVVLPGQGELARKELDALVEEAKSLGAGGLVWAGVTNDVLKSPLDKFFTDEERTGLVKAAQADEDDLILIVADAKVSVVFKVLGALRVRLAERFGLIPKLDRS